MKFFKFFHRRALSFEQIFGTAAVNQAQQFYDDFQSDYQTFDLAVEEQVSGEISVNWDAGFCFYKRPIPQFKSCWILATHNEDESLLLCCLEGKIVLQLAGLDAGQSRTYPLAESLSEFLEAI